MGYSAYKSAIDAIGYKRIRAEMAARQAYERALENDAFYAADKAYRAASIDCATGKATEEALRAAREARNRALGSIGLDPSDLEPRYDCPLCRDTGVHNGKPCRCAVNLFIQSARQALMIPLNDFGKTTPPPGQERIYGNLKSFCDKFPANQKRIVTLFGKPGVGKTYLAGCVANAILEKNYSVLALTAFGFNNRMLAFHTTFDDQKAGHLQPALDCDLLIIDDLGTESLLKNVTCEYLYQVISERNASGKHTLLTTNLSKEALSARYGERTYSRILDKNICYAPELTGKDLRNFQFDSRNN